MDTIPVLNTFTHPGYMQFSALLPLLLSRIKTFFLNIMSNTVSHYKEFEQILSYNI